MVQPLLDSLQAKGQQGVSLRERVTQLLRGCELGARTLESLRALVGAALDQGIESRELAEDLRAFSALVDLIRASLYSRVRALAAAEAESDERQDALRKLDDYDARAAAVQDYFNRLQQLIQTPPKLDVEAFLRERTAATDQDFEEGDSILARLKAGGDL